MVAGHATEDPTMKMALRRCAQCGRNDARRTWSSIDEAANDKALVGWTCPTCAWTEAELVEVEGVTADADPLTPAGARKDS